jgi:hypothetical protein
MNASEATRILSMGAAARRERHREAAQAELAQVETRAIEVLTREGWRIAHDNGGNWVATKGAQQ